MTTTNNEKLQRDLMRAIAVRALMNASGDNCLCPVKKPTKFIVTLKPVVKVPNADPFLNIQPKFSACTCNTKGTQQMTLTPEQIQVRNNTEALKGKTLLNAFRVLTNSKFISIDPQYNYGDSGILSPSCDKLRLSGGGWGKCDKKENVLAQVGEPSANHKECECQNKLVSPPSERITLSKCAKTPQTKCSKEKNCRKDRIYHILQRSCHGETLEKMPTKCLIVYSGGGYAKRPKEPKQKISAKRQCEPKVHMQRKVLEKAGESPICVEKAVGTSDYSCTSTPPQEPQKESNSNMSPWDPLKYFLEPKQKEDEKCKEKAPCPLKLFPFPGTRTPKPNELAPDRKFQSDAEPQQPMHDPQKVAPCSEDRPPIAEQPRPCQNERHCQPPKPRPPDISSEIIAQQCQRIHTLEQQVNEMRCELRKMKNAIIPPDDMLRCTALTSKLRELTSLLADLKNRHAEAIATVIMAQKGATCQQASEHTIATPARAVSTARAVSPIRLAPLAGTTSPSRTNCVLAPASPPPQQRPETRAEQVQTCFADNYTDQLSQTNTAYGWRPFIDEATQSSPPSTVRMTPKNTSSAPLSSHTSSAASTALPCRHNTGEIPLKSSPSFCPHCQCSEYPRCPYVEKNLCGEIMTLLHQHPPCDVLLSVLLQPNNIYHINISMTGTGEPLGCIYATEQAINEAVEANVFNRFLTFFIVDARISNQQKDKILAHTFEFFKN